MFQLFSLLALAAQIPSGNLEAARIDTPPEIDGYLTEAVWQETPGETCRLFQFGPCYGESMTEPTTVKILYDDDFVYFGFILTDPLPREMTEALTPRDNYINGEWIAILLDTWNDGRSAFSFEVSLANSQMDSRISPEGGWDYGWDAVWESGTAVLEDGWSAEFAIPMSCLRFPRTEDQLWAVNFQRILSRTSENGFYSLSRSQQMADLSDFAEISGISGVRGSLGMELRPYAAGKYYTFQSLPNVDDDLTGDAGLDLKMGLTSGITADFTLNPDFGQVEADEAEMNLGHFELFLREKRPFFMERSELFRMPFNLFYSRRIGTAAWNGDLVPILGGAKITGSAGDYRFGFLDAVTGRVWENDTTLVETAANYGIFRGIRELGGYSNVGVSLVSKESWAQNGFDGSSSGAAALDGAVELPGNNLLSGAFAGSWNTGTDDGTAWEMDLERIRSTFGYWAGYSRVGEDFNVNPTGFTTRTNHETFHGGLRKTFRTLDAFSSLGFWGSQEYARELDGETITNTTHLEVNGTFKNGWNFTGETNLNQDRFDPWEGPDGRYYEGGTDFFAGGGSNPHKPFKFWLGTGGGDYSSGGTFSNFTGNVRLMPVPTLEFIVAGDLFRTWDTDKYNWQAEQFDIRSTEWRSVSLRVAYMFDTTTNLRLFSQYSDFQMDYDLTGETESSEIRTNLLFSWEYMPGSMFYALGETVFPGDGDGGFQDPDWGLYTKLTWFLPI